MVKKLTTEEINAVKVEGKSSFLNNGVKENQKVFDALPLKVNEKLNAVIDAVNTNETGISGHNGNKSNPHSVTKAQVGLGNVDNTSDKDKPVSNAVKTELDKKADKSEVYDKTEVDTAIANVTIPVDEVLDSTSLNPVQNKVVAEELEKKADTVDIYSKEDVDKELAKKADKADLNGFVTEEQLDDALIGVGGEANLDNYYTKDEINSSLSGKADKSEVEAEVSGLEVALDAKADKATTLSGYGITDAYDKMLINSLLNAKANKAAVEADITALSAGMMLKADKAELELKADSDTMTEALAKKADKSELDEFITQAELDEALLGVSGGEVNLDNYYTKDEINSSLSGKADKSEVEAEVSGLEVALDAKADKATTLSGYGITDAYDKMLINSLLNAKANKAAVEADITALSAGMMLKADNSDLNNFYPIDVINDMLAGKADVSEVNALSNIVTELGDVAEEDVVPVSKGGTGATTAAEALTALGGVRIAAKQTYSGGGFCDNYLHLVFEFSPKLMFICGGGCSAVFVRDADEAVVCGAEGDSDGSAHYCTLVWGNDNSIWWRGDTIKSQFNLSGVIYTAYAIG